MYEEIKKKKSYVKENKIIFIAFSSDMLDWNSCVFEKTRN